MCVCVCTAVVLVCLETAGERNPTSAIKKSMFGNQRQHVYMECVVCVVCVVCEVCEVCVLMTDGNKSRNNPVCHSRGMSTGWREFNQSKTFL